MNVQYLYFLNGVDDKSVLQVFHGSLHPVVKGRRPFGKLQVQLINRFQQFLSPLKKDTEPRHTCECTALKAQNHSMSSRKQYCPFLQVRIERINSMGVYDKSVLPARPRCVSELKPPVNPTDHRSADSEHLHWESHSTPTH